MHNELYIALGKFVIIVLAFVITGGILYVCLIATAAVNGLIDDAVKYFKKRSKGESYGFGKLR